MERNRLPSACHSKLSACFLCLKNVARQNIFILSPKDKVQREHEDMATNHSMLSQRKASNTSVSKENSQNLLIVPLRNQLKDAITFFACQLFSFANYLSTSTQQSKQRRHINYESKLFPTNQTALLSFEVRLAIRLQGFVPLLLVTASSKRIIKSCRKTLQIPCLNNAHWLCLHLSEQLPALLQCSFLLCLDIYLLALTMPTEQARGSQQESPNPVLSTCVYVAAPLSQPQLCSWDLSATHLHALGLHQWVLKKGVRPLGFCKLPEQ